MSIFGGNNNKLYFTSIILCIIILLLLCYITINIEKNNNLIKYQNGCYKYKF
jgi:hypothetical protein